MKLAMGRTRVRRLDNHYFVYTQNFDRGGLWYEVSKFPSYLLSSNSGCSFVLTLHSNLVALVYSQEIEHINCCSPWKQTFYFTSTWTIKHRI